MAIRFSIIMPIFNQCYFMKRAITSLQRQTFTNWELIIINDGSTDGTDAFVKSLLPDPRVTYLSNDRNRGLGYSINRGLDRAAYDHIAYLPADDYYDPEHLELMAAQYDKNKNAALVFSGVRYGINDSMSYNPSTESKKLAPLGSGLILVQVSHIKTSDRWVERSVWESHDLHTTFWNKLLDKGSFVPTHEISCFVTRHPKRRSQLIVEGNTGGLNLFRQHYQIHEPIKIKARKCKFIDEEKSYAAYRKPRAENPNGLKILIVGELAYNPERIVALEEAGHKLYGLWVHSGISGFNTVGPLPFGNVEDIEFENWRQRVRELKPDIIYATLNFRAVTLAYDVLRENPDIPFVWHFKEGPSICLNVGTWDKLMYIYDHADGIIHISPMVKEWVEMFVNMRGDQMILDGDLPKKDVFAPSFSAKLSASDGQIHTLVTGRMIGWTPSDMRKLAANKIHVHHYSGDGRMDGTNRTYMTLSPDYFHAHPYYGTEGWVTEFSKYDAGWLHKFTSKNNGELVKASWDDLNLPARIGTYAAAGLPVILNANTGHMTSTNHIVNQLDIGLEYSSLDELIAKLKDRQLIEAKRSNMLKCRDIFTFDHHVPELMHFFKEVIRKKGQQ